MTSYFADQVNSNVPFWNARVFKNNIGIHYKNRMHETIEHHITKDNTSKSNIQFLHNGYELSDEDMRAKLERNQRLMLMDVGNPIRNYHLGNYELLNGRYKDALELYHKALKDNLNAEHIASVYNNIYLCEMMLEFPIEYLLETLGKSIQTLPLQLVARINVIEHFLRGVNTENKNDIIPIIEKELGKIEKIYKGKMSELHTDIQINEQFIQTKKEEIRKWQ
jgi:tetratricopeptide (TPR) repeat protein